jgi:hypothetical protein
MILWKFGRRLSATIMAATALAGTAQAATDGSLGTTSTGTVTINASVAGRVQISGLRDVSFTNVDPGVAQADAQNVCVWSNTSGRKYNVTASGSGTAGAFTLASGALTPVAYSVEWAQTASQSSGSGLTSGSALTGQASAATAPTCSSGPTSSASLIVRMAAANLQTMQAGAPYTGTLTLVVAPE